MNKNAPHCDALLISGARRMPGSSEIVMPPWWPANCKNRLIFWAQYPTYAMKAVSARVLRGIGFLKERAA